MYKDLALMSVLRDLGSDPVKIEEAQWLPNSELFRIDYYDYLVEDVQTKFLTVGEILSRMAFSR